MDAATEKKVLTNLTQNIGDKTLIAISHRNSLVRLATRILIVDGGLLVADDTPEKLAQATGGRSV